MKLMTPGHMPSRGVLALPLALIVCATTAAAAGLKLHVPSPDWRDQVIYFVMTDRFADGDARNNDQGAGEFQPGQRNRYQGGDLNGLQQRLGYIQGLGATALWITPPVANQWVNPSRDYFGYHGYWAENFLRVDRHLGSLGDYQALSDRLHRRGMYLVQDIVVNHMGNFFTYRDRWHPANPAQGFEPHDRTLPVPRPSQKPFDRNDPRDPAQQRAGIYHWTPDVRDYNDVQQEQNFQMSGLDDLNTENPTVRRALRQSYGHWVRAVGVDAFRVDTAFYVPPDYFVDFLFAKDSKAPGLAEVARRTGRRQFHVFGEGFAVDKPGQDRQSRKIESYMTASAPAADSRTHRTQHIRAGAPLLPGMLNFPLYGALGDVFARGRPTAELADRISGMMKLHARPHWMPTFVDNHDVDRFLAGGDTTGLQQALLAMFTLPGIPVIYYGTEQGFSEQRASMFAAGWGSGGRDHYNTEAPLYRSIAQMAALRRAHPVLSRGVPQLLKSNAAQPGALAWVMAPLSRSGQRSVQRSGQRSGQREGRRSASESGPVLVVFNTATTEALLDNLDTGAAGLPAGTPLRGAFGLLGPPADQRVGVDGRLSLVLPPRSAQVWVGRIAPARAAVAAVRAAPTVGTAGEAGLVGAKPLPAEPDPLSIAPLLQAQVGADFDVNGMAPPGAVLQLVVDGDLARAQTVVVAADGRWQARVGTVDMIDANVEHQLTVWHNASGRAAPGRSFRVQRQWDLQADVVDPAGDDTGPLGAHAGNYVYPTDPGWGAARQMDLRGVKLSTSGGALRLTLQMNQISQVWSPANGFDHVAFTVFIQLPGQTGGATVMPLQDGAVPESLRWHRRLRVHGWSNALFSDIGASAAKEGTPVTPGAQLQVDAQQHTVTFTLPAAALAGLTSLSGAKVWVTTWDYDGGYRALAPAAQAFVMGGAPAGSPKVMDSSAVIVLP